MANAALMAVKAMNATDVQLEVPIAMTAVGLFSSVLLGTVMARRRKKPFVVIPGFAAAVACMAMAWITSAGWFLVFAGVISIFDFAMRPAVPSIMRLVYPEHHRSHLSGTMRQWSSIVFLGATLLSSALLFGGKYVRAGLHHDPRRNRAGESRVRNRVLLFLATSRSWRWKRNRSVPSYEARWRLSPGKPCPISGPLPALPGSVFSLCFRQSLLSGSCAGILCARYEPRIRTGNTADPHHSQSDCVLVRGVPDCLV